MPTQIERDGDKYAAEVTPPHFGGQHWLSPGPMAIDALIAALLDLGCHQTDIGDALRGADPDWGVEETRFVRDRLTGGH